MFLFFFLSVSAQNLTDLDPRVCQSDSGFSGDYRDGDVGGAIKIFAGSKHSHRTCFSADV